MDEHLNFPNLIGADFFLSRDQVYKKVKEIAQDLKFRDQNKFTGIFAENSPQAVLQILAGIYLKINIALINAKDPKEINDLWLREINTGFYLEEKNFTSLIKTSGSTGKAKNVLMTLKSHLASAEAVIKYFSFGSKDIWGLALPLFHVGGLSIIFRSLLSGGSIFIAPDFKALKKGILEERISHISLVPAQYLRLLDEGVGLDRLKAIVIGGQGFLGPFKKNVYISYGCTETGSMVYINHQGQGQALSHAHLKQANDAEILVKAKSLFSGYLEDGCLKKLFFTEGYFATGDVGFFDDSGFLNITSRKDDRFIILGENIDPYEIEKLIGEYQDIRACKVLPYLGEVVAIIKTKKKSFDEIKLKEFLCKKLSPIKIPKKIFPWPSFIDHGDKNSRSRIRQWLSIEKY